jgi:hypothetical protein
LPFQIPPGANQLDCSVTVPRPGPFNSQMTIYADDGGLREIQLTFHGTAETDNR